jgi:hypothetical protein
MTYLYERRIDMNISDKVSEIMDRYYRDNYYNRYRYNEDDEEFDMKKELSDMFTEVGVQYEVEFTNGFSSCGYDNDFLYCAWINTDGTLVTDSVLLESM